jgi:coenzyme F420-dependent glucose-6-phosphate dehydrogenase
MMTKIGYQASHEQFSPSELIRYTMLAEQEGFQSVNSSDHFHPWSSRQGQSGFSFAWLGAAMQATSLPFDMVCSPGQRYHPAVVAQALATLAEMFPGRIDVALGSGEAINENITGDKWPDKQRRNERLLECAQIIRKLFEGETVSHRGLINVENAKLYTLPKTLPKLFCAAVSKETAAWAGCWADGLITVHRPHEQLREVVEAFRSNGGAGKPVHLKVQLSYAESQQQALDGAYDQWRTNVFQGSVLGDMPTTAHFDAAAEFVKPEDLNNMIRISSDLQEHIHWIRQDMSLGFERIILHNVNREQELFIREFGNRVLPDLI